MPFKFRLGRMVLTSAVRDLVRDNTAFARLVVQSLLRHSQGDWGEMTEEAKQVNEIALRVGSQLRSVYHAEGLPEIWIITEADRSSTTVLFPGEYLQFISESSLNL